MRYLFYFLMLVLLKSCSQFTEHKVVKNYYLVDNENRNSSILSYKLKDGSYVGISRPGVVDFAVDGRYILLQLSSIFSEDYPKGETQYSIVPIQSDPTPASLSTIYGPFSRVEFDSACAKLGLDPNKNFFK